jgi:hypothetical protein
MLPNSPIPLGKPPTLITRGFASTPFGLIDGVTGRIPLRYRSTQPVSGLSGVLPSH